MNIENIGFFGEIGSFTEQAAKKHFDNKNIFLPFDSVESLLQALTDKKIQIAVLPFENSTEGIVTPVIDSLFVKENGFAIIGETILLIEHYLIGIGKINEIKKILSHPQALAQCNVFLRNINALQENFASTSAAIKKVAEENNSGIAAIGSLKAFEFYKNQNPNLKILAEKIQNVKSNKTRFIILGFEKPKPTNKDKTSLFFSTKNKPLALVAALLSFGLLGINMTHIVSRPSKKKLGEYVFFVEAESNQESLKMKLALKLLKISATPRVLGSYPNTGGEV